MAFGDMTIVQDAVKHVRKHLRPIRPTSGRMGRTPVMRIEHPLLHMDYFIEDGAWWYQSVVDPDFPVDPRPSTLFPCTSANARLTAFIAFQLASNAKAIIRPSDSLERALSQDLDHEVATATWYVAVPYLRDAAAGKQFTVGAAKSEASGYLVSLSEQ